MPAIKTTGRPTIHESPRNFVNSPQANAKPIKVTINLIDVSYVDGAFETVGFDGQDGAVDPIEDLFGGVSHCTGHNQIGPISSDNGTGKSLDDLLVAKGQVPLPGKALIGNFLC